MSLVQKDLTHLVTLLARERYVNDADFRLRRCQAAARWYVKKRLIEGKEVKSKYDDADFILQDNRKGEWHEKEKT